MMRIMPFSFFIRIQKQHSQHHFFLPILPLYFAFGSVIGFIQACLPPMLRAQGLSLQMVGVVYLLYLPIGFSFFWASFIDRFDLPFISGRRGWIVCSQFCAAFLVFLLGFLETAPLIILFFLGLMTITTIATMDIALEAYIVENIADTKRPSAAAFKIATSCLGGIVGGGLLLWASPFIGWKGVYCSIAILILVSFLPFLFLKITEQRNASIIREASLLRVIKNQAFRQRLIVLLFAFVSIAIAFGLNRLVLVDLGIDIQRIGLITGTISPLVGILFSMAAGQILRRFGRKKNLYSLLFLAIIVLFTMASCTLYPQNTGYIAMSVTILGFGVSCAIVVVMSSSIIQWSQGSQAGTDFALQYGLSNITATFTLFAVMQGITYIGWFSYFIFAAVILCIALVVFERMSEHFDRIEKEK